MKLGAAIAEILKREGIEILCGYPVNHLIEYAADPVAISRRVTVPRGRSAGLQLDLAVGERATG
jgi:hypothetical protein